MSILMYMSIHGIAPAYLRNEITLHLEIAERTTKMYLYHTHLESFKNSFTHRGPIVWNSLPDYVKTCRTLHSFKANIKLLIMN